MNKEIQDFIYWYMKKLYPEYYEGQHSFIVHNQFKRCHDVLESFMEQNDINTTDLKDMAESFFENVKNSDHNINHFCTPGVLKMRYAEVFEDFSVLR